jgi:DNA-binding transcriptional regulator YiaG
MTSPSNLKAQLFDLADQDREAIRRIRERLEIHSNALAVRLAIRELARRLEDGNIKPSEQDSK